MATMATGEDREELDDLLEDMAEDKLDDLDVADTPSLICLSRILLPPLLPVMPWPFLSLHHWPCLLKHHNLVIAVPSPLSTTLLQLTCLMFPLYSHVWSLLVTLLQRSRPLHSSLPQMLLMSREGARNATSSRPKSRKKHMARLSPSSLGPLAASSIVDQHPDLPPAPKPLTVNP